MLIVMDQMGVLFMWIKFFYLSLTLAFFNSALVQGDTNYQVIFNSCRIDFPADVEKVEETKFSRQFHFASKNILVTESAVIKYKVDSNEESDLETLKNNNIGTVTKSAVPTY